MRASVLHLIILFVLATCIFVALIAYRNWWETAGLGVVFFCFFIAFLSALNDERYQVE